MWMSEYMIKFGNFNKCGFNKTLIFMGTLFMGCQTYSPDQKFKPTRKMGTLWGC